MPLPGWDAGLGHPLRTGFALEGESGGGVTGGGTSEDGRGGLKVVLGGKLGSPAAAGGEAGKTCARDSKELGQLLRALDLLV